jgi:hypothetical protein
MHKVIDELNNMDAITYAKLVFRLAQNQLKQDENFVIL